MILSNNSANYATYNCQGISQAYVTCTHLPS